MDTLDITKARKLTTNSAIHQACRLLAIQKHTNVTALVTSLLAQVIEQAFPEILDDIDPDLRAQLEASSSWSNVTIKLEHRE